MENDVIRAVQTLAVVAICQRSAGTVIFHASNTSVTVFTENKSAVQVKRQTVRTAGTAGI